MADISKSVENAWSKEILDSILADLTAIQATLNSHVHSGVTAGSADSGALVTPAPALTTTDSGVVNATTPTLVLQNGTTQPGA